MAEEYEGMLITLEDEEGVEREFEHVDTLELDGSTYVALVPAFENGEELLEADGELVILKVTLDDDGEELLVSIEDEAEFDKVAIQFEERLADEFEFTE